ncbi:hypothetical protein OSJ05_07905 [Mycobacterium ulcerans]
MIVSWPARITDRGGLRSQFHHVVDIAPTILEAAGIPAPEIVNGVAQKPHDGISLMYTFDDAEAADRRRTQYFEIGGLRGIYHEDWMACTYHGRILWRPGALPAFSDDRWEFYDLFRDYSQAADLSAQFPDKLEQLKALFDAEGVKNNVFPLDDRGRLARALEPRPTILGERTSISFRQGATRIPEDIIRSAFNRSYSITAVIDTPGGSTVEGVLLAAGDTSPACRCMCSKGSPSSPTTISGRPTPPSRPPRPCPPAKPPWRWNSTTTAAVWAKGDWSDCCSTDATSGNLASNGPCRWASAPTRASTSAWTAEPRPQTPTKAPSCSTPRSSR